MCVCVCECVAGCLKGSENDRAGSGLRIDSDRAHRCQHLSPSTQFRGQFTSNTPSFPPEREPVQTDPEPGSESLMLLLSVTALENVFMSEDWVCVL